MSVDEELPEVDETCALQVAQSSRALSTTNPYQPSCAAKLQSSRGGAGLDIPDSLMKELVDLIEPDYELPPVAGGMVEQPRLYRGTIYAFARLAELSYCGTNEALIAEASHFDCKVCKAAGFKVSSISHVAVSVEYQPDNEVAFVGKLTPYVPQSNALDHAPLGKGCAIAFQGTHGAPTWIKDFEFFKNKVTMEECDGCEVHHGFHSLWGKMKPGILDKLYNAGCYPNSAGGNGGAGKVYLTGHSLGGALATIAAFDLHMNGYDIAGVISFESPRVGNAAFQEKFNSVLSSSLLYRVTYAKDIVPHVPPRWLGYQHVNPEIYFPNADLDRAMVCSRTEDHGCSWSQRFPWSVHDHCSVPYVGGCNICQDQIICPT